MKISTKGRYAVRVMLDLALNGGGECIKVKEIAARQGLSEKYLEQIIAVLNRAGYVKSVRGAQGGYRLAKEPENYTVGMVLRLTEGSLAPVACLEEGIELRRAGVEVPILILGYTEPVWARELIDHRLTQGVFEEETARALSQAAMGAGGTITVHMKVDTGMSRLGLLCDERDLDGTAESIQRMYALPGLNWEGIFTHFSHADGSEEYTMLQFTRFLDLLGRLEEQGVTFKIRHCAASAAVLHYPCTHMDMVRPGIALYGHYPAPSCEGLDGPGLKPVMSLYSRVAAVREFPADTPVSYGCTAQFGRDGGRTALLFLRQDLM